MSSTGVAGFSVMPTCLQPRFLSSLAVDCTSVTTSTVEGEGVGAGFEEAGGVADRFGDHQVDVEEGGGDAAGGGGDGGAETDVGDEVAVHDVEVEEVDAAAVDVG